VTPFQLVIDRREALSATCNASETGRSTSGKMEGEERGVRFCNSGIFNRR